MAKTVKKNAESPAPAKPLVNQAYDAIREKIICLQFLPGQYLNEAAICEMLSLGRTPVHQALQMLQLEGLIEILPRKGVIVQPDSIGAILKILEARLTVEPVLARMAAEKSKAGEIPANVLAELTALANEPDETADPPDIDEFVVNDRAFHRKISELSGNDILGDFARSMHERSCRFWYLNLWQTLNVSVSKGKHLAIAKTIVDGDEVAAFEAMSDHINDLSLRLKRLPPNAFGGARAPQG